MAAIPPTIRLPGSRHFSRIQIQPVALRITVLEGPDRGLVRVVERHKAMLGRAPSADVTLTDPTVSDFHVELHGSARAIFVADSDSSNGVFVDDLQIEKAWVWPGTKLRIGKSILLLETDRQLVRQQSELSSFGALIGKSAAMRSCFAELEAAAACDDDILLEGESGTGKDLAARAIHAHSQRRDKPFVVVNCGALPHTDVSQVHSTLFGHYKGSFTGALKDRKGAFREANSGVLFLDEIGDLPLEIQTLLLHTLEQRQVTPLGSDSPMKVDVRVIFATWHHLPKMVNEKRFRLDLYYRMGPLPIHMPSLAERREDIPLLIDYFVDKYNRELNSSHSIDLRTRELLQERDYRGNVRELEKLVKRLVMRRAAPGTARELLERHHASTQPMAAPPGMPEQGGLAWNEAKALFERSYLDTLIKKARNHAHAARLAGVTRTQLSRMMERAAIKTHW